MTAWTSVDHHWWGDAGWVADMGPYIGPWPPLPPPLVPVDAAAVDYYIALPNPDGLVVDFPDPSDASNVSDVSAYPGGGTHSSLRTMTAGAHLIIQWYTLTYEDPATTPPSASPESLTPPDYAAAGTYTPPGHWSDWQDPWAMPFPVTVSSHETLFWGTNNFGPPTDDTAVYLADAIAATRDSSSVSTVVEGVSDSFVFFAAHHPLQTIDGVVIDSGETSAEADVGYYSATYLGSALADTLSTDMPPSLPVYADTIPLASRDSFTVDARVQYESDATTFAGWQDSAPRTTSLIVTSTDPFGTNFVPPASFPWTVGVVAALAHTGAPAGGAPPDPDPFDGAHVYRGPRIEYGDLDVIASFTMNGRSTGPDAPYSTDGIPEVVDSKNVVLGFSAVAIADFSVLPMMGYMGSDTFPAPTLGPGYENLVYRGRVGDYVNVSVDTGVGQVKLMFSGAPSPVVLFTSPRWRYWIPPGAGPKLRTVGGHWASVGGATVNMMQADMTWIPIQDGV